MDLYLVGDIPADLLAERRKRLEHTVSSLEHEASKLLAQLESDMLRTEQIESLLKFTVHVSDGLDQADADFATRVQFVNQLEVEASLVVEEGGKVTRLLHPRQKTAADCDNYFSVAVVTADKTGSC